MIPSNTVILGVVSIIAIIFFFTILLREDKSLWQTFLRYTLILFSFTLLLLIPKAALDAQTVCETVVSNSTEISSTVTAYEYEDFCYERSENTALTFFGLITWLIRGFWFYILVWFIVAIWGNFGVIKKDIERAFRK